MALYGTKPSSTALAGSVSAPLGKVIGLQWNYIETDEPVPYFNQHSSKKLAISQLRQLILTHKGERVMLPDFGLSLTNLLFEPLTSDLVSMVAEEVEVQVNKYLPSVQVLKVSVSQDDNMYGYGMPGIHVNVTFRLRGDSEVLDIKVKL